MNKILINISAFLLSIFVLSALIIFNKEKIVTHFSKIFKENLSKTESMKNDLESGKIIIFGSSELTNREHKFIPQNYFNKDLKLPLSVNGHAGHQNFAIMSQLATYSNKKVRQNARVVIFLSPGWFNGSYAKGTTIDNFLEYMYASMMYKLYLESDVDDKYKILISDYLNNNVEKLKNITQIYKYALSYKENHKINSYEQLPKKILVSYIFSQSQNIFFPKYKNPNLNFSDLKIKAKEVARLSDSNKFGIYNEYFTKFVKPNIDIGNFPYKITVPPSLKNNQEYKDLLDLLDLLKDYKIKPLFIMQDLHPYVYIKNRDSIIPLLNSIKKEINRYGYGYLDMWSYKQEDYEMGTLTDIMHTGELGWVKINQKIIEHFIGKTEDKK